MGRLAVMLLVLAPFAFMPGCKTIKKVLDKETEASLTVTGQAEAMETIERELNRLHKVKAATETVEKGITIIRIYGAYKEVVDAISWMILQNLRLLANDEVSEKLLEVAVAALK